MTDDLKKRWLAKHPGADELDLDMDVAAGWVLVDFHGDPWLVHRFDAKMHKIVAKKRPRVGRHRALMVPEEGWFEIPDGMAAKVAWRRHKHGARYRLKEFPVPPGYALYEPDGALNVKRV